MTLKNFMSVLLPAIEAEMQNALAQANAPEYGLLHHMLAYHLGWEGEAAGPEARGKRIRPMLVLLACAAAGGAWQHALPAAAAVELVHNFSLIHDDIEDNSPLRRGRPTVWTIWGIPQAINAGDALFTLAHLSIFHLDQHHPPALTLAATSILQSACLQLTQGQFLDISFEQRQNIRTEDYWCMISGKTAALLGACTELGAITAQVSSDCRAAYKEFGLKLGLAFQSQDDILGIWGDAALTGKSNASDLVAGKKSLPILFGIENQGDFFRRWAQGPILPEDAAALAALLEKEGSKSYTQAAADRLTQEALAALERACPDNEAGNALRELAAALLNRQS